MIFVKELDRTFSFSREQQRGQVLLIVVLVMVVALTVGLSVATRSITNLRTTTEEEQSQRAFSAAEAGLEQSLKSNSSLSPMTISESGATVGTTVNDIGSAPFLLNNGVFVTKDDGSDVWLSNYPDYGTPRTGTLHVHFGLGTDACSASPATNSEAAIEVIVIQGNSLASPQLLHYVYDPCSTRSSVNNFTDPISDTETIGQYQFRNRASVAITNGRIARIIPLYASTPIGIRFTGGTLPSQGSQITSTGSSGEVQRKITAFRGYPKLPTEFFQYLILAPR
jgi:Tfp pilus assembly protein PilX